MIYNSFNEAGMVAIGNVEMPVDMMLGGPMTSVTEAHRANVAVTTCVDRFCT